MIFAIDIDIYLTSVLFLVETSPYEFDKFYYEHVTRITDEEYKQFRSDIENEKSCMGFTNTTDNGDYIVYLRDGDCELYVAHEIYHVVNRILMDRGVSHNYDDEPYAYLNGWLKQEYSDMLQDMRMEENNNKS